MKITETKVTEAQIEQIEDKFVKKDAFISIDVTDVKEVLVGKEGVLYEGQEEIGVGYETFFQHFFAELIARDQVKQAKHILISIGNIESAPLSMTDMSAINEAMALFSEDAEICWGVVNVKPEDGLVINVICANPI